MCFDLNSAPPVPVIAGAAMALSSVSVLGNALLLRRAIEKERPR